MRKHFLLFAFFLFLPTFMSLEYGGLRVPLYRAFLILFLVFYLVYGSGYFEFNDKFVARLLSLFVFFCFLSLFINHNIFLAIESSLKVYVETVAAFLMPSFFIRDVKLYRSVVNIFILLILVQLIITIPHLINGSNWVFEMFGADYNMQEKRLGYYRANGTFDHSILLGVVSASMISFGLMNFSKLKTALLVLTSFTSISAGAFASIAAQSFLILWRKIHRVNRKWRDLFALFLVFYVVVEILSDNSFWAAILYRVTFSPETALGRLDIAEWGFKNIIENPFFGLGYGDWVRLEWMSSSFDNYWMLIAMRYGIPAFTLYFSSCVYVFIKVYELNGRAESFNKLRLGWLLGAVGIFISGCTVDFWNNSVTFVNFYLGMGYALILIDRKLGNDCDEKYRPREAIYENIIIGKRL